MCVCVCVCVCVNEKSNVHGIKFHKIRHFKKLHKKTSMHVHEGNLSDVLVIIHPSHVNFI